MHLRDFGQLYYISNIILMMIYPLTRILKVINFRYLDNPDEYGLTRENSIFYTIIAFSVIKWFKRYSIAQYLSDMFFTMKIALITSYVMVDIRIAAAYATACLTIWLFFRQPIYRGPTNITPMKTIEEFEDVLGIEIKEETDVVDDIEKKLGTKQKKSKKKNNQPLQANYRGLDEMVFCEFYVEWAETCIFTRELWAEFSLKYSNERIKFISVDLQKLSKLAKLFTINTSAVSRQLPTLILFENGEEVQRFPPIDKKSRSIPKVLKYERKEIAKYFDLDRRYLSTRDL